MIEKHLNILGHRVIDVVSGFEGVATSICFDLYGCIQVAVNPGVKKDGTPQDSNWFDINRLLITSKKPVMEQPNFASGRQAEGKQGAAEKPRYHKP